jgi:VanZ family protein
VIHFLDYNLIFYISSKDLSDFDKNVALWVNVRATIFDEFYQILISTRFASVQDQFYFTEVSLR